MLHITVHFVHVLAPTYSPKLCGISRQPSSCQYPAPHWSNTCMSIVPRCLANYLPCAMTDSSTTGDMPSTFKTFLTPKCSQRRCQAISTGCLHAISQSVG